MICFLGICNVTLFGLTPRVRLERQLNRLGNYPIVTVEAAMAHPGPVLAIDACAVIDEPLLPVVLHRSGLLLLDTSGAAPVAVHSPRGLSEDTIDLFKGIAGLPGKIPWQACTPSALEADFWKSLRKRETPYALLVDGENTRDVAWRMFMGTYKGATDLVTKHLWPRPAFCVTSWLAPRGVSPNMVTVVGILLVFLSFFLFYKGYFLTGLISAWLMTFLDTVDGKLARTTLTSSKWGDVLDHGIDLVHPPFWYVAWGIGLAAAGYQWSSLLFWSVIVAILGGYILQRIMEGIAIKWLGLEIHIWRPIDTLFRQVTARRNPNLILLTLATVLGRPDWGLIAVALWTVICLVLHGAQLALALAARRTGPLTSWMSLRP